MKTHAPQFRALISCLVVTLQEEVRQNRRLLAVVKKKKDCLVRGRTNALDGIWRAERELILNAALVERDRIAMVTELGEIIGHSQPSRLRIAEILLYAAPEDRDELLEIRDEFRDIADELEDLTGVVPGFTRHRQDHIRLYVTPSRSKAVLGGLQPEHAPAPAPATVPAQGTGLARGEHVRR